MRETATIPDDAALVIEDVVEKDEGGWIYTNRSDDAGGHTYGGMTWKTFDRWQKEQSDWFCTESGFVSMAIKNHEGLKEQIRQCYYDEFYLKGHCDEVPAFIRQAYFSALVNFGDFKEVLKWLQMACNQQTEFPNMDKLFVDGHWGPQTKRVLNRYVELCTEMEQYQYIGFDAFKLAFSDACMERYIRIVQRDAKEWRERARELNMLKRKIEDEHMTTHYHEHTQEPRVLQSENLMGWFNRAVKYRTM